MSKTRYVLAALAIATLTTMGACVLQDELYPAPQDEPHPAPASPSSAISAPVLLDEGDASAGGDASTGTDGSTSEVDPDGKTLCDGNNQACYDAGCQGGDGKTDTTDPCWCTHCDNGNYCAAYDEHQANDNNCHLTGTTSTVPL